MRVTFCKVCLAFASASSLFSATINVPSDYNSIQAAIGSASNGDTIIVAPGTYSETINFRGKAITLKSSGGPAVTIIDGRSSDSVVRFGTKETPDSILQGFTIEHGLASFNNSYLGGGISISGASPTITGNVITLNQGSTGSGIAVQAGAPLIQGNTVTANSGEGIYVLGSQGIGPQIIGNVISKNTGGFSAGIDLFASGPVLIQNNLISGNTGSEGGGIGMVNGSNPTIVGNIIVGNKGGTGGGFYSLVPSGATAYILNNTIIDNDSPKGSALYIDGNSSGVQVVNNVLLASSGQGAVYCGNFNTTTTPLFRFNDTVGASNRNYEGLCDDQSGRNGNISADPLLVCRSNANYRLSPGSPAIDAGDASATGLPKTDYETNPRIVDGLRSGTPRVDMGAYEFQGASVLNLSTPALSFGNQLVGSVSASQSVVVQNTGAQTAWFCGIDGGPEFPQSNDCADQLNAGQSCTIKATFAPVTQGSKAAGLRIPANTASSLQVNVSGTGVNPAPMITALSPTAVATAGGPFTLTVTGSGFVPNSSVLWNGSARPATVLSSTKATVSISAQDILQPGVSQVTVMNLAPGGGTSAPASFTVSNAVIAPGGVLNSGSYTAVIVPGEFASVFGTNLSSASATFTNIPLPTTLANTSVYVNAFSSPLISVSPGQINFQVPWEVTGQSSVLVRVVTNGITSASVPVSISTLGPALLSTNQQGTGQGSILIANTATLADSAHPVNRTQSISIFCLGLGPVSGTVNSGATTPFGPPLTTLSRPAVTIGGVPGAVSFSGLVPGSIALYQVNVRLPLDAPVGGAVPVALQIGEMTSNTVTIGVQ